MAVTSIPLGELEAWPKIALLDHRNGNEFRAIVARPMQEIQVTGAGTGQVTDPVTDSVTDPVIRLLLVLDDGPMAPSMIQDALGLKHRPTFRTNYLYPALESGLIEMTIPDKPQSSQQRSRLTAAGQQLLQQRDGKGLQS